MNRFKKNIGQICIPISSFRKSFTRLKSFNLPIKDCEKIVNLDFQLIDIQKKTEEIRKLKVGKPNFKEDFNSYLSNTEEIIEFEPIEIKLKKGLLPDGEYPSPIFIQHMKGILEFIN